MELGKLDGESSFFFFFFKEDGSSFLSFGHTGSSLLCVGFLWL